MIEPFFLNRPSIGHCIKELQIIIIFTSLTDNILKDQICVYQLTWNVEGDFGDAV